MQRAFQVCLFMADGKDKALPGTEECSETAEKGMGIRFHGFFSSFGIFCSCGSIGKAVRDGGMEERNLCIRLMKWNWQDAS